jgi:hypothetical protein
VEIICHLCLHSDDMFRRRAGDPTLMNDVFLPFVKGMCSSRIIVSAYSMNTNTRRWTAPTASSVTRCGPSPKGARTRTTGSRQLPAVVFAINNAASTLGDGLTPVFIDRGEHPRLPLPAPPADGETQAG